MIIQKVAIIGACTMGSAIAYVTALNGFEVVVRTRRGHDGMTLFYDIVEKAKQKNYSIGQKGSCLAE